MIEETIINARDIINYRKKANITREELAANLGVTGTTIHNWENENSVCKGKNASKLLEIINQEKGITDKINGEIEVIFKFKNINKKDIKEILQTVQSSEEENDLIKKTYFNMILVAPIISQ